MAIWYTDNINGNDTTGLGTIAAPYKTIVKAIQVGTQGDEIRVAGSGFTALPGTATASGGSFFTTSQSLVGLVNPGDIITYNDVDYGDKKFFFKVFSVTATTLTLASSPNIRDGVAVNLSKLTQNHYFTNSTNITIENINSVTTLVKSQFDIRGGWINNFTEQTGWTAMVYHSTSSASAQSSTAFSGPQGPNMYMDRFMLVHLSNGLTGSSAVSHVFFPGTIAALHMLNSLNIYTAQAKDHTNPAYIAKDAYLTNAPFAQIQTPQINADGSPALSYMNVWSQRNASVGNIGSAVKIENLYAKSFGGNNPMSSNQNLIPSAHTVLNNLFVSSTAAGIQYNNIVSIGAVLYLNGSITKLGSNKASMYFGSLGMAQYILPTQNIENIDTPDNSGFQSINAGLTNQNFLNAIKPTGYIKDQEGEKTILGTGQIIFADPTQYSTGTNSLRVSKSLIFLGGYPICPIESLYVDSLTAKTITVRCKSSTAGSVVFSLISSQKYGLYNTSTQVIPLSAQTKTVSTEWTDVTYTGLDAYYATLFLNSYIGLGIDAAGLPGKYIWIDSVTVS